MPKRWVSLMVPVPLALVLVLGGPALAQADAAPAVTEQGRLLGEASTAIIGPDGGEVRSLDSALTVTVPPGALAAETRVGVQSISNHAPLGVGGGYRLTPAGMAFAEPVTLTFAYDDGVLAGQPPEFLWFISQNASGTWSPQRSSVVDTEAKTVTVSVTHFSDWAVGRFIDLALEPAESVVLPGESVVLGITGFMYDPDRDNGVELVPLDDGLVALTEGRQLLDSTERFMGFQVQNWRLNGQDAPGNATHGTLDPLERKALYTAPGAAPDPNTVAVSVDLRATNRDESFHQYTLVASITIHTAEYYITLNAPDGSFLFVGGDDSYGTVDLYAVDAQVSGGRLWISGLSEVDWLSIDFLADGSSPGSYPVYRVFDQGTVGYRPPDYSGDEERPNYIDWYYDNLVQLTPDFPLCTPMDAGVVRSSPFTVTIDRFEKDEDSGIEVVYGSYAGTLYAHAPFEWLSQCAIPPNRSAALSGTFKLPVDRQDGTPSSDGSEDGWWEDESLEDEDIDLVPLAPPG